VGDTIIREIKFANVDGPKSGNISTAAPVREVCVHHHPSRVDFQQQDGSNISNIVSRDSEGSLLLTFSFEWRHPEVEDGSDRAAELKAKHEEVYFKRQDIVVRFSLINNRSLRKLWRVQSAPYAAWWRRVKYNNWLVHKVEPR
jgi:hypothetical protein